MYNPNRLSGIRRKRSIVEPHRILCGLVRRQTNFWLISIVCCCSRQEPRPQRVLWGFCIWWPYSSR